MKALTMLKPYCAEYVSTPKPEAKGRLLTIKVERAGICATDFSIFTGESSFVRDGQIVYPVRFGHEWAGVVTEVGEDVEGFKPGDRVYTDNGVACGVCSECQKGRYDKCAYTKSVGTVNCWDGCFAEYMSMPVYHTYHLPDSVSFEEAALIEPLSISYDAFHDYTVTPDTTVVVIGTGAIGMGAVWLAKYFGAARVVLIGRTSAKLEVAKQIGADILINNTQVDAVEEVRRLTDGLGADLVIETSGSEAALAQAVYMTATDGRVSSLSFYEKNLTDFPMDQVVLNKIRLVGGAGRFGNPQKVCEIMEKNPIKVTPIISHRIPFDGMKEFLENMEKYQKSKIKVMVEFD